MQQNLRHSGLDPESSKNSVIPAHAGIQSLTFYNKVQYSSPKLVIPAKAGIQIFKAFVLLGVVAMFKKIKLWIPVATGMTGLESILASLGMTGFCHSGLDPTTVRNKHNRHSGMFLAGIQIFKAFDLFDAGAYLKRSNPGFPLPPQEHFVTSFGRTE